MAAKTHETTAIAHIKHHDRVRDRPQLEEMHFVKTSIITHIEMSDELIVLLQAASTVNDPFHPEAGLPGTSRLPRRVLPMVGIGHPHEAERRMSSP